MERYVPALAFRSLSRFYDPVIRAALPEARFKARLIAAARIAPGHSVLDLGCGTATMTLMIRDAVPDAKVVGLDGDADILALAVKKVGRDLALCRGMSYALPFRPGSFDRVLSSLVFHHLTTGQKRRTLASVYEILKPGGELHMADWGHAQNALMRAAFLTVQLSDGFETTNDNVKGMLVPYMREAGFREAAETYRQMTAFGTLAIYRAVRP